MKKRALRKEFYMEIKTTRNRFLSLMIIVALGVAFFSGVRASNPDMVLSADTFYDASNLMDIRVLGTLGMTDGDLEAISQVEGVEDVMAGYSVDMLGDTADHQLALQVLSLPDRINQVTVREGRLPEGPGECLVDTRLADNSLLEIGDTVTLKSGSEQDTEDLIRETEYLVVGTATSPLYLSLDRGTTTVGTGSLDGFLMIPSESFAMDYYTQIYVTAKGAGELTSYTDAYDDYVDELVDRIKELEEERCTIRYEEVQAEGAEKIADGEADIAEGEQKLLDARTELEDGRKKLSDAQTELADAEAELSDGEATLQEKEQELSDARKEIDDGWNKLNDAKEELVLGTIEIEKGYASYEEEKEKLDAAVVQWEEGKASYEENAAYLETLRQQKSQLEQLLWAQSLTDEELAALGIPRLTDEELAAYQQQLTQLEGGIGQLEAALPEAKAQLDAAESQITEGQKQLSEAKAQLDYYNSQIESGGSEAIYAQRDLEEAEEEWADGHQKLQDAREELEEGRQKLADAREKLADAEQELSDGQREYEEAAAENEPKIADAKEKIADAKQELADLKQPEWYVLDRQYTQVYVEYGQDAERIGAIGEWFPAIFFLVAALVCLTTMTRMVEEERTQIGTLKALGYSSLSIAAKYIFYALLSSLLGSLLGILVGQRVLPLVIINAYRMLYANLPWVLTPLNLEYSVTSSAVAVLCTTVAAVAACYKEFLSVPAALMRPQAPKAGKRVFLEHLPFLWKRLDFSHKATVRNLVRYKKRFFMTIFGIGGCMALLLLGFGLRDSIRYIGTVQYGEIRTFEAAFNLEEDASEEEKEQLCERVASDERTRTSLRVRESALDVEANGSIKSGYLLVPQEPEELVENYVHLRTRGSKEPLQLQPEGVIITEKLAKLLDVQVGDTILLKEDETQQVETVITDIAENYFMHYIYMSPQAYVSLYGEEPEYNTIYANMISNEEEFEEQLRMEYLDDDAVSDVSFNSSMEEHILDMLKSLDTIIWVLVVAAGLLAFVVLYNLNNINVSERKRELATLKVLGFYDREVTDYVNRENLVLTVLGVFVGVFLGILLHRFLIVTVEIDILMFGRNIKPLSYVYSIVMTFLFSWIVNVVMHFKLKKIDMVESMKSVE